MSLRARVISGLFWIGGTRLLGQILSWGITIVVVRLLDPGDYGLLAMATVFMGFLSLLAEAGLGAAIIRSPQLDEQTLRRIFGVVILINCTLFVLQYAAAPLVAKLFDEDRLVAILRVLAIQFLVMIFSVVPGALLVRKLNYRLQSMVTLAGAVVGSLTSLAMAWSGYGVWALVTSNLVAAAFTVAVVNMVEPFFRWPEFSLQGTRSLIVTGGHITATRVLYFIYSQADVFIGARIFGKDLLGVYSISLHLASLPVQRISAIVNQIAYPAFAHSQHDPAAVAYNIIKGIRMLSFLSFPVLWGMSSIARELIDVLLGAKWESAILPLQLLPLIMPFTILSPFLNSAFQGIGKTGVVLGNVATACVIMPIAFLIGAHWGLMGMSLAWILAFPLVFFLNLRRMLPIVGLKFAHLLLAVVRPAIAAVVMYACVFAMRIVIATISAPLMMAALILTGIAAYALTTLATNRAGLREVFDLFRKRAVDEVN